MIYIVLLESVHPSIRPSIHTSSHSRVGSDHYLPSSPLKFLMLDPNWPRRGSELLPWAAESVAIRCFRLPPQDQLWSGCPNSRPQKSLAGSRNPPRGTTHGLHDFTVDYSTWASTLNLNAAASLSAAKVRQDNPLNTWTGNYWRVWRWCCERDLTESWMCPELGQWNRNLQSLLTEKFGTRRFQFV